jgi:hypothetical protein
LRRPATKVVIFQWPCGTLATSRSPRGQRPRSLVMLVEVPVSSMKTSLVGSSRRCSCFQFARAVRTSSRSCSAACRLFFEANVVAFVEPPHRTGAHHDAAPAQPAADFFKRQVRFGGNQTQQPIPVGVQRRALAPHRLGRHRSASPPARNPPDCRTRAHLESRRSFMAGSSRLDRTDNPFTQILRIGLRHRRPPESSIGQDSPIRKPLRIPPVPIQLNRIML